MKKDLVTKQNKGLAHKDDLYETPDWLFNAIQKETGLKFKIDVACNEKNAKCTSAYYDALNQSWIRPLVGNIKIAKVPVWCNPPRSENGKFVNKAWNEWREHNIDIVMLLCWNDLGNKYGEKLLLPNILNRKIKVRNLGKVIFDKNGKPSEFPSRLTYFYAWFKRKV